MLESLEIVIEFGLGLAGFAGIIVALAGDPGNWPEQERVRVFGLIFSALLACFSSFLCIALSNYISEETSIRIAGGVFFLFGVFFFPRQVYRTFYVYRQFKGNYSRPMTICFAAIASCILSLGFVCAVVGGKYAFSFFYSAMILTVLFSAITYIRLLLYRPAGALQKVSSNENSSHE